MENKFTNERKNESNEKHFNFIQTIKTIKKTRKIEKQEKIFPLIYAAAKKVQRLFITIKNINIF